MSDLARRARGLPVAVAVLVISASVAFAGGPGSMPEASADGLEVAAEAAGKVVPVGPASEEATEEATEELEPTEEEPVDEEPADNHGATVSEAARMETPEGFANHGAFVSCIARMPKGEDAPAIDLSTITPESCAPEDDAEVDADEEDTEGDAAVAPSRSERGKSAERGRGAERSAAARAGRG